MVREEIQTDQILHGRSATPVVTSQRDPSTFFGFCCGAGLPRVSEDLDTERLHGHHTFCPVWELEKKRIEERKEKLAEPRRRGMSEAAKAVLKGTVRDIDKGDAIQEWLAEEPQV
jgi:hypothetical protein